MTFTAKLEITLDPAKKDPFDTFILPDDITVSYIRQQLANAIDIDHPGVNVKIVSVKEKPDAMQGHPNPPNP